MNHALPDDILVRAIQPVPDAFSAVTSTTSKRYQYLIWNEPDRPLFFPDLAWHRWQALDVPAMRDAAARLVGEHDFASFARPGHGKLNTVRTILACEVSYRRPKLVIRWSLIQAHSCEARSRSSPASRCRTTGA